MALSTVELGDRILVGGEWWAGDDTIDLRSPHTHETVATVPKAGVAEIERALDRAVEAFETTSRLPAHERSRILAVVSDGIRTDREDFARTLVAETGKPIRDARVETDRAISTFAIASEEARRIPAEVVNMDWASHGEGRFAVNGRFPIGVVLGIAPFNFPLNLVAHKVAPSLAAGNAVVVKPASQTPLSALRIARLVDEAGWPSGGLSVVTADAATIEPYVADARVAKVTFTGSMDVGWRIKKAAWRKKVTLELGGNAGVVVHEDADVEFAVGRIVAGGFGFAGQSCISVQRVYVQRSIWDRFLELMVPRVEALKLGDPSDDSTDVGPLITESAAEKAESWIAEALRGGARALTGGTREGAFVRPTILVDATPEMKVCANEVFAPVVTLAPYDSFEEAISSVDDSAYGLQAGVFTRDVRRIWYAWQHLEVGGVMINEIPTFRIDQMPYGGVKESGWGREGLRYAIEEMTEPRLLSINLR